MSETEKLRFCIFGAFAVALLIMEIVYLPLWSVNKVNWDKVGRVTEPGRYMLRFGYVVTTAEDLAIWTQFPEAEFALVEKPSEEPNGEFKLGAFDVTPAWCRTMANPCLSSLLNKRGPRLVPIRALAVPSVPWPTTLTSPLTGIEISTYRTDGSTLLADAIRLGLNRGDVLRAAGRVALIHTAARPAARR